jgi:gamma-glutamylcyclotransferase (GGCT)/AIG2-like uncharacterized protein YtfP
VTDRLIACFVYGTLRPTAWNDRGGFVRIVDDCTIEGKIYWVSGDGGYPVAKLDLSGRILGDVLWFPKESPVWKSIDRMERGAGYDLWDVVATDPEGEEIKCSAWHYMGTPRGKLIPSGDWLTAHDSLWADR